MISSYNKDYLPELRFPLDKFSEKLQFFKVHPICRIFNWRQMIANEQVSQIVMIHRKTILIWIALKLVRSQNNIYYFLENRFVIRWFSEKLWFFKVHPFSRIFNWRRMVLNEQLSLSYSFIVIWRQLKLRKIGWTLKNHNFSENHLLEKRFSRK